MNIYLHELRSLRKSTLIWTCAMIALAAIYFSVYDSVVADAEGFAKLLSNYPAPVRAALGISLDNITTVLGFYSLIFSFITLCAAIQAMNLGLSMLSREARERTADFLLVKPISRTSIVSAKLLAALTTLLATNIVYFAGAFVLASMVKTTEFDYTVFFMINLTLLFLQLIFLALGLVISMFFAKLKSVLPLSLGVVFGLYIVGAIIAAGKEDAARFISPFKYFDISYIMKNVSFETPYLIVSAVIVVVSIAASYIIYDKKDIHAVS